MKALKRMMAVPLTIAVVLISLFLAGRYGWKLGGFRACQGAGITSVEVSETAVHIAVNIRESGVYSIVVEARRAKGTIHIRCEEGTYA